MNFPTQKSLQYAKISLLDVETEEDLDIVVSEQDAIVCSTYSNAYDIEVDAPVTYRKVLFAFDKILQQINGETNHIFLERIEISKPKVAGQRARIWPVTGS